MVTPGRLAGLMNASFIGLLLLMSYGSLRLCHVSYQKCNLRLGAFLVPMLWYRTEGAREDAPRTGATGRVSGCTDGRRKRPPRIALIPIGRRLGQRPGRWRPMAMCEVLVPRGWLLPLDV